MTPLFMKDAVVTIGATGYQAEISSAVFTPSSSVATWKGLTPTAVFTETSAATWVVDITFAQDPNDALSLGIYLFEHEGESVTMVFEPKAGGAGFTGQVVITPGAIGGAVDGFAEATVSLPVQGRPSYTPPVLAARAGRKGNADDE